MSRKIETKSGTQRHSPLLPARRYAPPRSPIEIMIDAATGYAPPAEPRKPTPEEHEAADTLAHAIMSDLRYYYPDVVKTRPTTWPTHLRNTIAMKVAQLLAEHNR